MKFSIKTLEKEDIESAVELVRNSFDPNLLPFMIYGQNGIGAYIAEMLPRTGIQNAKEYFVAIDEANANVIGFADFDVLDDSTAHLAYICVDSTIRRHGLASRLINHFIHDHSELTELQLDVFGQNHEAQKLYSELGFVRNQMQTTWITRQMPKGENKAHLTFRELHESIAAQDKYSFSKIQVSWHGEDIIIGRLGENILRFSESKYFLNDELLEVLNSYFPNVSSALLITNSHFKNPTASTVNEISHSYRMIKELGLGVNK